MTRAAKQTAVRQRTAAYSASQPLFDSLRIGCDRIGEQKAHLTIARNIVQNLHVKLPVSDPVRADDDHARYVDCAVQAWRSATAIYSEIFECLASLTAAHAEEGREERQSHAVFKEMARTAEEARRVAQEDFVLFSQREHAGQKLASRLAGRKRKRRSGEEQVGDVAMEDAREGACVGSIRVENESKASEARSAEPATHMPTSRFGVDDGDEGKKREVKFFNEQVEANLYKQKRQKQEEDDGSNGLELQSDFVSLNVGPDRSDILYRDVSADVEARLQAKQAKKEKERAEAQARDKAKKRKRESNDSVQLPTGGPPVNGHAGSLKKKKPKMIDGIEHIAEKHEGKQKRGAQMELVADGGQRKKKKGNKVGHW